MALMFVFAVQFVADLVGEPSKLLFEGCNFVGWKKGEELANFLNL